MCAAMKWGHKKTEQTHNNKTAEILLLQKHS